MLRQSHTATIEQNAHWTGTYATEPYEAAWASEAIFFIRALAATHVPSGTLARIQISPDGIHWCDEGTKISIPIVTGETTFARVRHFGGFLRLAGHLPEETQLKVMTYIVLKT